MLDRLDRGLGKAIRGRIGYRGQLMDNSVRGAEIIEFFGGQVRSAISQEGFGRPEETKPVFEDVDDGGRGGRGDLLSEGKATEPVYHDGEVSSVVKGHVEAAGIHRLSRDRMEDKIWLLTREQWTTRLTFGDQFSNVRSITWPVIKLARKSFGLSDTWMSDVEEGEDVVNGILRDDKSGAVEDDEAKVFDFDRAEAIPHGHERAAWMVFWQLFGRFPGNQKGENGGVGGVLRAKFCDFEKVRIVSGGKDVRVCGTTEFGDGGFRRKGWKTRERVGDLVVFASLITDIKSKIQKSFAKATETIVLNFGQRFRDQAADRFVIGNTCEVPP